MEEEAYEGKDRARTAYGDPLSQVTSFNYMGASSCSRGQQLAVSGAQPQAHQTEVGVSESDIDQRGIGCPYIGTYLLGSGAIGSSIQVIDMGTDAAYEKGVGQIPPLGGLQYYRMEAVEG